MIKKSVYAIVLIGLFHSNLVFHKIWIVIIRLIMREISTQLAILEP